MFLAWGPYRGALGALKPTASPAVRTEDPGGHSPVRTDDPLLFLTLVSIMYASANFAAAQGKGGALAKFAGLLTWQAGHVASTQVGSGAVYQDHVESVGNWLECVCEG